MNYRLILSMLFIFCLSLSGVFAKDNQKQEDFLKIMDKVEKKQIGFTDEGFAVTMSLTLDECAEHFGTPTRKELEKLFKEEEKKRFWSSMWKSLFVVIPIVFVSVFCMLKK